MAVQTLTLMGRKFVVMPQGEYERLRGEKKNGANRIRPRRTKRADQEAGDIAEVERRRKDPRPNIPWEQVKRDLGL